MNFNDWYADVKPLTLREYERAKSYTVKLLNNEPPERSDIQKDFGSVMSSLDWMALVIFVAALIVSSLHVFTTVGKYVGDNEVCNPSEFGIYIDRGLCIVSHQVGLLVLAETSMILFLVMFKLSKTKGSYRLFKLNIPRWLLSIPLWLSVLAVGFILFANLSSGMNPFLALLAPAFTIGVGMKLEGIFVELLERRKFVDETYDKLYDDFQTYQEDITKHPEYRKVLLKTIWDELVKKNSRGKSPINMDVIGEWKVKCVQRELQRDTWVDNIENKSNMSPVDLRVLLHDDGLGYTDTETNESYTGFTSTKAAKISRTKYVNKLKS